jgi:alpha-glucosidase
MNDWWKGAVIYQIYPRSFFDTSENGVGDIKGITRKLDYISNLGVDAIWLSPIFTSPMKDMGYDVSDYKNIDPLFGNLEDFDELIKEAHKKDLKVIIDQVLSHSSDQISLFQESRKSKTSEKSDWYVWADPKKDGSPPNNWLSMFGGSAWEWEPLRDQYYLHNFLPSQPDFNFHNLEVQDWLLESSKFWLERGVNGFRLDTVNYYFHDYKLRDNPPSPINFERPPTNLYYMQNQIHSINQKENLKFIERFRNLLNEYPETTCVGEIGDSHRGLEIMSQYTKGKRLHMAYSFELLGDKFTAEHIIETLEGFFNLKEDSWPCWSFSNHDVIRHVSRWDQANNSLEFAKLTCALLLSLKGSVCIYQGEELGQLETELDFDELTDPPGIRFWPKNKGRDGCRTPMTWDSMRDYAGFSSVKPWLPVKSAQIKRSVNLQEEDKNSVLHFYRDFISFRKEERALIDGDISFHETGNTILFFSREGNEKLGCLFNLSSKEININCDGLEIINTKLSQNLRVDTDKLIIGKFGFGFFYIKEGFNELYIR